MASGNIRYCPINRLCHADQEISADYPCSSSEMKTTTYRYLKIVTHSYILTNRRATLCIQIATSISQIYAQELPRKGSFFSVSDGNPLRGAKVSTIRKTPRKRGWPDPLLSRNRRYIPSYSGNRQLNIPATTLFPDNAAVV